MFNTPLALFKDRTDAELSLEELRGAYADYLRARENPASAKTIAHYLDTTVSFEKSLLLHGKPPTVGQLTPHNVRTWLADQRSGALPSRSSRPASGCSNQTIRPRHAALKSFSRKFILEELKLTHRDLLEDVERFEKEVPTKTALTQDEIAAIRACFLAELRARP